MKRLAALLLAVALAAIILHPVYVNFNTPSGDFPTPPCPPSGCGLVPTSTILADGSRMAPILQLVYVNFNAPSGIFPIPPCPPCGCGCVAPTSTVVADGFSLPSLLAPANLT